LVSSVFQGGWLQAAGRKSSFYWSVTFVGTVSVYESVADRPDVFVATTVTSVEPMPFGVYWISPIG
jgi:hypothetical protein